MTTPTCDTCAFWQHRHEIANTTDGRRPGSCRHRSPIIIAQPGTGKPVTRWPLTMEDETCGDYAVIF